MLPYPVPRLAHHFFSPDQRELQFSKAAGGWQHHGRPRVRPEIEGEGLRTQQTCEAYVLYGRGRDLADQFRDTPPSGGRVGYRGRGEIEVKRSETG
jgi:hypothetical protein